MGGKVQNLGRVGDLGKRVGVQISPNFQNFFLLLRGLQISTEPKYSLFPLFSLLFWGEGRNAPLESTPFQVHYEDFKVQ